MTDNDIEFDELVAPALAQTVEENPGPRPEVKERLLATVRDLAAPPAPAGFSFRLAADADWLRHPCSRESHSA